MLRLDLPSEYLLMATRDRTGKPMGWHQYGFGGALLIELALGHHIRIEGKRVVAGGPAPQDPLLAMVWDDIRTHPKAKTPSWWVQRLSGRRYALLRRQITHRLVDAGILAHQPQQVFWWTRHLYPSRNTGAEHAIRQRIRGAVARQDASDPQTTCLTALLYASEGLKEVADGPERRALKRQAKLWIKSDPWAKAVGEVVQAIMAAVVAATVASTAAS